MSIKYYWKYRSAHRYNYEVSCKDTSGIIHFLNEGFDSAEKAHEGLVNFLEHCQYFDEELVLVVDAYANNFL